MTKKAMKYGLMTIAAVLLVAMAFAGAASAAGTFTAAEWNDLTDNQVNALTGTVYIVDADTTAVIYPKFNESTGFSPEHDLTLDFAYYKGTFSKTASISTKGIGALFGYVDLSGVSTKRTLTIQNLNLTNAVICVTSGNYVGGIVGFFNGNSPSLSFMNFTNCNLINSSITGSSSTLRVGGLVGRVNAASVNIEDCKVMHCDVVTGDFDVGGMVGYASTARFVRCNVTNSTIASTGKNYVGGLIADADTASFDSCGVENTSVYADGDYVGGLIGAANSVVSKIKDCMVKNCAFASGGFRVGGLVGSAVSGVSNLEKCSVEDSTIKGLDYAGALFGYENRASYTGNPSTVKNCAVSGGTNTDLLSGGTTWDLNCLYSNEENFLNGAALSDTIEFSCPFDTDYWHTISYTSATSTRSPGPGTKNPLTYLGTYGVGGTYGYGSYVAPPIVTELYISSAEEWKTNISTMQGMTSGTIYLTDDIDFEGASENVALTWEYASPNIEGNGHTISNFNISGSSSFGLFGKYYGTRIANLTISNFSVSGDSYVGGLVGYAYPANAFENLSAKFGNVTAGHQKVGGLVGYANDASFTNCSIESCVVAGNRYVGGLVGDANYASVDRCKVVNCSASAYQNVGGLVGYANYASRTPFMNGSSVTNCIISAGNALVGGLVGEARSAAGQGIKNCTVENCVIAGLENYYLGGLVGAAYSVSANFTNGGNWLNTTAIRGTDSTKVASVVGYNSTSSIKEYWQLYPSVMNLTPIWLHNTSDVMDTPIVIIAKSDVVSKRGPENESYFNKMGSKYYYGEPTALNTDTVVVTRLTGYGYKGQYSAVAYVYPTVPEYAITNMSFSNGTVSAYNATNPAGTIDRAKENDVVHLIAVNNTGYHFNSWNVTNSTGLVPSQPDSDGNFTMPDEPVNVDAVFYANTTTVNFYDDGSSTVNETAVYTFGNSTTLRTLPTKSGYTAYWNVSETAANLKSYVSNGNWAFTGDNGSVLNAYVNWTQNPTPSPSYSSSSSRQTGYTQILQEVPTTTPTVAPTAEPTPATPTVITTAKPTTQATQQSPAPFLGLLAGLGAAAVLLRMRK